MEEVVFFTCFPVLTVLYGLTGCLLLVRRQRKQVSSRSPLLLFISHIGNYCEQLLLLGEVTGEILSSHPATLLAIQVFFHFVYFFPYLLRGYRLYFVFHADLEGKDEQISFVRHINRAKQTWLLRILILMLLPVAVFCCLMVTVSSLVSDLPGHMSENREYEAVIIADGFIEEILLLICIYSLRKVNKDYSMTGELVIIGVLWYFNSLFSLHSAYSFWRYELLCRNTVIMAISALWPVLRSYQQPDLKELLTLPALTSLQITLQNEVPFDYFEDFLQHQCRESSAVGLDSAGPSVLRLYMAVQVYKDVPTDEALADLVEDFKALDAEVNILDKEMQGIEPGTELWLQGVEDSLYSLLHNYYFSRFLKSAHFHRLWRFVEQQELKTSKVNSTSLYGKDLG